MLIPRALKIGHIVYKVVRVANLHDSSGHLWGSRDPIDCAIRLDEILHENHPQLLPILLHEVLHDRSAQYGCHLDEDNIERLGNGLAAFLTDNGFLAQDVEPKPKAVPQPGHRIAMEDDGE
jgi:hypothetical protein